jgi:hypothetical protein
MLELGAEIVVDVVVGAAASWSGTIETWFWSRHSSVDRLRLGRRSGSRSLRDGPRGFAARCHATRASSLGIRIKL